MNRISWDEYYMNLAVVAAQRATCERRKVGCVIVNNFKIVGTGYNGSARGSDECEGQDICMNGGLGCQRTIHAELNAILNSGGESVKGGVLYVTTQPCFNCAKVIVQAGIGSVIYLDEYRCHSGINFLKQNSIEVNRIEESLISRIERVRNVFKKD